MGSQPGHIGRFHGETTVGGEFCHGIEGFCFTAEDGEAHIDVFSHHGVINVFSPRIQKDFITGAEQAGGGIHHKLHSDRCLVDRGGETQLNGSFPIGIQGTSGLLEIHTQFRHCLFGALHIGRGCSQRAGEQSDQHCRSQKTGNQFVFAHNATSVYIWI